MLLNSKYECDRGHCFLSAGKGPYVHIFFTGNQADYGIRSFLNRFNQLRINYHHFTVKLGYCDQLISPFCAEAKKSPQINNSTRERKL